MDPQVRDKSSGSSLMGRRSGVLAGRRWTGWAESEGRVRLRVWGPALDGAGDRGSWGLSAATHLNKAERGPGRLRGGPHPGAQVWRGMDKK